MYSNEPPHMAEQKQDDQLEHTYSSYVRIRDIALKICQRRWTIGRRGERRSGISVLVALHDDIYIYIGCSLNNVYPLWLISVFSKKNAPITPYTDNPHLTVITGMLTWGSTVTSEFSAPLEFQLWYLFEPFNFMVQLIQKSKNEMKVAVETENIHVPI